MATFNKFNQFVQDLANKKHDLSADTLKVMLTNTAPVAGNSILSDITEIATGNGYVAGGTQASTTSSTQTGGTEKLIVGDVVFTASGGSIGPFRYAVFYNATQTSPNKPLIGWHDYGASITLLNGESFTWDADQAGGILTIA
jgi:hypothetical protein